MYAVHVTYCRHASCLLYTCFLYSVQYVQYRVYTYLYIMYSTMCILTHYVHYSVNLFLHTSREETVRELYTQTYSLTQWSWFMPQLISMCTIVNLSHMLNSCALKFVIQNAHYSVFHSIGFDWLRLSYFPIDIKTFTNHDDVPNILLKIWTALMRLTEYPQCA